MTLASALWTFEKKIFQRGDLHVLLAQQSNKDLETNWSYWGACRGSGALKTLACVEREGKLSNASLAFIFSHFFLLRTAPHYLNAWNRLNIGVLSIESLEKVANGTGNPGKVSRNFGNFWTSEMRT